MATDSQHERYTDGSTLVRVIQHIVLQCRVWIASSRLGHAGRVLSSVLATAASTSFLTTLLQTLTRWTCHSFLYRWLTKEPEPDVIVIDLRETYIVGPIIALLDRLQPRLEAVWRTSTASRALDATTATVHDAPVRAAGIVVSAAVLVNTLLVALGGSLSPTTLLPRVAVLGFALAATRVSTPWEKLAQSRTVQLLRAALEPPEPPNE